MAFRFDVIGKRFGPAAFTTTPRDVALYALGSGATAEELDLLYERRGPKVLPSFAVVPAFPPLHQALEALGGNMLTLVHGGQRVTLHRPIPASGALSTTAKVDALYDKGKGALAIVSTETTDPSGAVVFETEWQIFFRGEGGFGGERGPEPKTVEPAAGQAPDFTVAMPTAPTQALLYRLASHDLNPIHIDPEIAGKAGFPAPILHGLCTFSHATRALVQTVGGGDPDRIVSVEGRFAKPVFPGDTLTTEVFRVGPGQAAFVTRSSRQPEPVLTFGQARFR